MTINLKRRRALVALGGALAGCAAPMPDTTRIANIDERARADALALLNAAKDAHGLRAYRAIHDLSLRYDGKWATLATKFQPVLTDPRFRGGSEERWLPRIGLTAQLHRGPGGTKFVTRGASQADVRVSYNGELAPDNGDVRAAAALVVDGYRVFLIGPLAFDERMAFTVAPAAPETLDGRICDGLAISARPGLGFAREDRFVLHIDRETKLMRRVRFTLDGLDSTRGAIADVDVFDYIDRDGVKWPTRFIETLVRPIPNLSVHEWRLMGLDTNRGFSASDITQGGFQGTALAPARLI